MRIYIICPICNKKALTDTFSCEECLISCDGTYQLTMECLNCEKDINVTLTCIHDVSN